MRLSKTCVAGFILAGSMGLPAQAQYLDEVVVTGTRIDAEPKGQFLTVPGDNLLLEVYISSDDRDATARYAEIEQTITTMMSAAKRDADISISFVDDGDLVRPLTRALYEQAISSGRRPDTNVATIQLKTPIPDNVTDTFALARRLQQFATQIPETGRITIDASDEVIVSVVNPQQYRADVLALITTEIRSVTKALGPDYRAILDGIDGGLKSFRAGDLELGFYLPYSYRIIPDNITTLQVDYDD